MNRGCVYDWRVETRRRTARAAQRGQVVMLTLFDAEIVMLRTALEDARATLHACRAESVNGAKAGADAQRDHHLLEKEQQCSSAIRLLYPQAES